MDMASPLSPLLSPFLSPQNTRDSAFGSQDFLKSHWSQTSAPFSYNQQGHPLNDTSPNSSNLGLTTGSQGIVPRPHHQDLLAQASGEDLISSGNAAYMHMQLIVERQKNCIAQLESRNRSLEVDIMAWRTRCTTTQEIIDKLVAEIPQASSSTPRLLKPKDKPSPLHKTDYPNVRFWTAKSFDEYMNTLVGETDGLATRLKKRGRPPKSKLDDDDDDLSTPYLETSDGVPVSRELMVKVGHKARRLWQALKTEGVAPNSWRKASETIYNYFTGEMLNEKDFEFFRYGEGNWKIDRWAGRAYSSWKRNHLTVKNDTDSCHKKGLKRKRELLDDPRLLQMESDLEPVDSAGQKPLKSEGPSSSNSNSSSASPRSRSPPSIVVDPLDDIFSTIDIHTSNKDFASNTKVTNADTDTITSTNTTATITTVKANTATDVTTSSSDADTHVMTTSANVTPANTNTTADVTTAIANVTANVTTTVATATANVTTSISRPSATHALVPTQGGRQQVKKRGMTPAVVGKGLTEKNFCMRDWLLTHPGGLKEEFETHFQGLSAPEKKVFKDAASAAKKVVDREKKTSTASTAG